MDKALRIFHIGIYIGCGLLLATQALQLYLGDGISICLSLLILALFGLSIVGLIICLIIRPSTLKFKHACLLLLAVSITILLAPLAQSFAWALYLEPIQSEINAFVQDITQDGRIREMSDGQRYFKSLNNKTFDASSNIVESSSFPPLTSLLKSEGIDLARYENYRRRLISMHFIEVEVTETYVALLKDGFLDNLYGVLWVRPGSSAPILGSQLFNSKLVSLRPYKGNWYIFGTT